MGLTFRAHWDGKVIVPDEPIDLPVRETLMLTWQPSDLDTIVADQEHRRRVLEEFFDLAVPGGNIPNEALRREYVYEDRI